jgi:hypothetical protein
VDGGKIKTKLKAAWDNLKYAWNIPSKANFKQDTSIWLLGKLYHLREEGATEWHDINDVGDLSDFLADFRSRIWCTYRTGFEAIPDWGLRSDCGWGCMLRCGQMMLAQALSVHLLGRNWQLSQRMSDSGAGADTMYKKIVSWFNDTPSQPFSIHRMVCVGRELGHQKPGGWYGPSDASTIIKLMLDRARLAIPEISIRAYVAYDCTVYLDELESLATTGRGIARDPSTRDLEGSLSDNENSGLKNCLNKSSKRTDKAVERNENSVYGQLDVHCVTAESEAVSERSQDWRHSAPSDSDTDEIKLSPGDAPSAVKESSGTTVSDLDGSPNQAEDWLPPELLSLIEDKSPLLNNLASCCQRREDFVGDDRLASNKKVPVCMDGRNSGVDNSLSGAAHDESGMFSQQGNASAASYWAYEERCQSAGNTELESRCKNPTVSELKSERDGSRCILSNIHEGNIFAAMANDSIRTETKHVTPSSSFDDVVTYNVAADTSTPTESIGHNINQSLSEHVNSLGCPIDSNSCYNIPLKDTKMYLGDEIGQTGRGSHTDVTDLHDGASDVSPNMGTASDHSFSENDWNRCQVAPNQSQRGSTLSASKCAADADSGSNSRAVWTSALLLLVPIRLGGTALNPLYIPKVKTLLSQPSSVGIIGGKRKHALYFLGFHGSNLICLDPHVSQPYTDISCEQTGLKSFHCSRPKKLSFSNMDPSCTLGFLFERRCQLDAFLQEMEGLIDFRTGNSFPLFTIVKNRSELGMTGVHYSARFDDELRDTGKVPADMSGTTTVCSAAEAANMADKELVDGFVVL